MSIIRRIVSTLIGYLNLETSEHELVVSPRNSSDKLGCRLQ
jgi:hypothetical protein